MAEKRVNENGSEVQADDPNYENATVVSEGNEGVEVDTDGSLVTEDNPE
jgi:hypothetical protein